MLSSFNIKAEVLAHNEEIIRIRRDLHRIPEVSFKEEKTS